MVKLAGITPVRDNYGRAPFPFIMANIKYWWLSPFMVFVALAVMASGLVISIIYKDWGFLGRSGAIAVVIGTFLMGRPIWRKRYKSKHVFMTLLKSDGDFTPEQAAEFVMDRVDTWFFHAGFALAAVGSVIWGFADLINCFYAAGGACAIPVSK